MSEGPSNALVTEIMTIMTQSVAQMEAIISKTTVYEVEFSVDSSQQMQKAAKISLNQATEQLKRIQELLRRQSQNQLINQTVSIAVTVVVCTVTIALGQPEIALMAAAICAMQESGANDMIVDSLSKRFLKVYKNVV